MTFRSIATLFPLLIAATPALAQRVEELNVYPAMSHGGVAYAVRVDAAGTIVKCQPLDAATPAAKVEAGCAALKAKGVPASVAPAEPKILPRDWIGGADYPREELAAKRGGRVEMIFEVDAEGKVAACRAWKSSGNEALDRTACRAVMVRARFSPATYKGTPVPAVGTMQHSFRP